MMGDFAAAFRQRGQPLGDCPYGLPLQEGGRLVTDRVGAIRQRGRWKEGQASGVWLFEWRG